MSKKFAKYAFIFVFFALLGDIVGVVIYPLLFPAPSIIKEAAKFHPIVRLHDMQYKGHFFCSGSVISDRYILTAAHCVLDKTAPFYTIEIKDIEGKPTDTLAMVVGIDPQSDLAILTGDFHNFGKVKVVTDTKTILSRFYSKDRIMACGFPRGGRLYCSNVAGSHQVGFNIVGTGSMYPGMSGGPVFDVSTGEVIGVNTAVQGEFVWLSPTIELYTDVL